MGRMDVVAALPRVIREEDIEDALDLPDDLTPFITRTSMYPISGGFGDVWKCSYDADGISTPVAVKAFRFSEDCDLESMIRTIRREIGILKILRHNNIVALWGRATGFECRPELDCLVSPWMPNGTLHAYLKSRHDNLTVLDRSRLLEDVSAGLRYLHSVPVMHGDITGANILIDKRGHARLIDFGLSSIIRPLLGQSHLAISSVRPGVIRYAAPELVTSDDAHDLPLEKADIYSFGCVMLQILSGRLPWSEIQLEYRIAVLLSQGRGPQRPDGHPSIIDLDWNFIQKCLRHEPELRPSADEVLDFVMHRLTSSGSSRPPDDPPDDAQDGFPGTSLHNSPDADTSEQPPDSPPSQLDHKLQDPRTWLNDELQSIWGNDKAKHIRWETWYTGSPGSPIWHSTIYLDDMNYGSVSAANKSVAQNEAARVAYNNLRRERTARGRY